MKKIVLSAAIFSCTGLLLQSGAQVISKVKFFESDTLLHAKLATDINKLMQSSTKPVFLPATFSCNISDSDVSEAVRIIARGNMRRKICYLPPVKINFHNQNSPFFHSLGSIKLVSVCFENSYGDQLVLKEYLAYKIYNLLTEKSFRVRLLDLTYEDATGKKKASSQHAFMIEDEKALAKRNDCKLAKDLKIKPADADRNQINLVSMFEYMIGNTDWGFSVDHNTILIESATDSTAKPFVIPHDFDYSGFVNANYAVPGDGIDIENILQRYYMGFTMTMNELNDEKTIFNNKKDNIYSLVKSFELLTEKNRKEMIAYLDDFYKTINNSAQAKHIFIEGQRKE